jgi:hypothetical protein
MKSYDNLTLEEWDSENFYDAIHSVERTHRRRHNNGYDLGNKGLHLLDGVTYDHYRDTREHWIELRRRFALHPSVVKALVYRPLDWQLLLWEWPHVSIEDPTKLAYSRNWRDILDDRQTRTNVGKYLKRHWPQMPDHMIRDLVAVSCTDQIYITQDLREIIWAVEVGPRSCMTSNYGSIPFNSEDMRHAMAWKRGERDSADVRWDYHPYSVYDPEYGWGLCIRINSNGDVAGRGLVNNEKMVYVRTYGEDSNGYSGRDFRIEAWLNERGYRREDCWPCGLKLDKIDHPSNYGASFMVPYIDGSHRNVEDLGDYLVIDECGDYSCGNTDATPDENRPSVGECECCGDTVHEGDDYLWAGRNENRLVCENCQDQYEEVRAEDGAYYVHQDYTGRVENRRGYFQYYVHIERLPDDVVWVERNDCYAELDDVTFIESRDEYVFSEDDDVVQASDGEYYIEGEDCWEDAYGTWHPEDEPWFEYDGERYREVDGWQCDGTNLWYPDCIDSVSDSYGNRYHPDYLQRVSADAEADDEDITVLRAECMFVVVNPIPVYEHARIEGAHHEHEIV